MNSLVKLAKKGNKEALLQLIMEQKDDYYRLSYTYMGNEHDAMDAMEDMIMKAYEKIHQLRKEEAFYSWSKKILVNSCKTMLRKRNKVVLIDDWNKLEKEPTTGDLLIHQSENQMELENLLVQINSYQQEAIKLKYFMDLDYKTIAELTNVSVGTVKSRIFQGLKRLKELHGGERS